MQRGWRSVPDGQFLNFNVDVTGSSADALDCAIRIAMLAHHNLAGAYRIIDESQLLVYRDDNHGRTSFAHQMDAHEINAFVAAWLMCLDIEVMGAAPERSALGWHLKGGGGDWEVVFVLEPVWMQRHM